MDLSPELVEPSLATLKNLESGYYAIDGHYQGSNLGYQGH